MPGGIRTAFVSAALGLWVGGPMSAAVPQITLDPPLIRLPPGQAAGSDALMVKVEGVTPSEVPDCHTQLQAKDDGIPEPPHVSITFSMGEVSHSQHGRLCVLRAIVAGLPYGVTQTRSLAVSWANGPTEYRRYTLTNRPDGPSTVIVKAPPVAALAGC